jgi:hypothetical protein
MTIQSEHPENEPPNIPTKAEITITYNGLDRHLPYNPHIEMKALLEQAMDAFNITENRHTMALWTVGGVELPIEGNIKHAGVKPKDVLVLRPSAVRGGSC